MDRYEVVKELGRGSYGVVNLCKDKKRENKKVVVKNISFFPEEQKNKKKTILDF